MTDYFIAVDGGGTNSGILISKSHSAAGATQILSGPANINTSVTGSWTSIITGIEQVLGNHYFLQDQFNDRFILIAGLAGSEGLDAADAFLNDPIAKKFERIELLSDSYIACLGAHSGNNGILLSLGTGTIGHCICSGTEFRVSGWGFPHSDEASGANLGMQAIRLLCKAYDKRIAFTPFLEQLFVFFDNNINNVVSAATAQGPKWFAEMGGMVVQYHQHTCSDDPHILEMIRSGVKEICLCINALDKQAAYGHKKLPVCLSGGLSEFWITSLPDDIQDRLVAPAMSPEEGALHYAQLNGITFS